MDKIQIKNVDLNNMDIDQLSADIHGVLEDVYEISPWNLEQTKEDILNDVSVYFLALDDQKVVGFISGTEIMDEFEITNIAILKDYQGKGISSMLLKKVLNFDDTFFLEVRKSNDRAINLYKKFFFETYHERKKYYKNPVEDAILMRLERK